MKKIIYLSLLSIIIFIPCLAAADLIYEGSSTISDIIMPSITAAFEKKTGIKFSKIGRAGSGMGFKALKEDKADIGGMSRSLTNEEKDMKYYYIIAGYDAMVVFVNKSNRVNNLSTTAIKGIFTGRIKNWKEVGGANAPIAVFTENKGGGSRDEFRRLSMDGADFGPSKDSTINECVKHVASDENAITFASIAFMMDGVKSINYDVIEPSMNNVNSGAYPLSRPMIFMTKNYPKGDLKKFFDFILSSEGQKIIGGKIVPVKKSEK